MHSVKTFGTTAALALIGGLGCASGSTARDAGTCEPDGGSGSLCPLLAPIAASHNMPALGAAVSSHYQTLAIGVTGVRKVGDPTPVAVEDAWHLGSDTKAMTATLIAIYDEGGTLSLDATLPQLFPSFANAIDSGYQNVTLRMLLAHVGGAPAQMPADVQNVLAGSGLPRTLRAQAAQMLLTRAPGATVGAYAYANASYIIAGAALEQVTGLTWDDLMQQRLFGPLGMSGCGFGPMATPGQVDAPWGHQSDNSGDLTPQDADNPPSYGPAGTVHCSLESWLRFLREHLNGANGAPTQLGLSAASWTALHTPPSGSTYALGWETVSRPWANGIALQHNGSNTLNYADVWIAPAVDRIYVSVTNRGDGPNDTLASSGSDAAVAALVQSVTGP